jgi:hypothetical protein
MRVGVGVGAVMLGGGCDAISEAKARVLGEDAVKVEATGTEAPAAAPVAAAPTAPEPMLLTRDGMSKTVEDVVASSKSASLSGSTSDAKPSPVPPVEDLGRPRIEPEGSRGFVPYDGGSVGVVAGVTPVPEGTETFEKPRSRPRPKLARPVVEDEPCDPGPVATPGSGWVCGPCGRG